MDHKRQHWIPQSYLKAWCDPTAPAAYEPYVWQFAKDGSSSRRRAPKNIFFENELYTLTPEDGTRDLSVERLLGKLESQFVTIRERKLRENLPLTAEEHVYVCAFVAAMQSRTPFHLDHTRSNWERVAALGRRVQQAVDAGSKAFRSIPSGGPSYTQEEVEHFATAERGEWIVPMLRTQVPILCQMNVSTLESDDDLGFITSDAPCVWFDPQGHKYPPHMRTPGLLKPTIEITFPCSPSQLLVFTWKLKSGRVTISDEVLLDLNRRTRFHAQAHFITRLNAKREQWFDPGKLPE